LLTLNLGPTFSFADESSSKLEIRKFRFSRNTRKNFERLVIEFSEKGSGAKPSLRTVPLNGGNEATVEIGETALVGAIPEALINDSYVARSSFLGPISINTDGPVSGFTIRTFLKQSVAVDAFWLEHPARLVLDVFPANSPRVDGRPPIQEERPRKPASTNHGGDHNINSEIVCYPLSSAVSATVGFASKNSDLSSMSIDATTPPAGTGPEPVICFLAASRVMASITYKPKNMNYVQWEGFPNSGFGARNNASTPYGGFGTGPGGILPKPGAAPPGAVVIPDVPPGKTPLGKPLLNPSSITRLPNGAAVNKIPSFSEAAPTPTGPKPGLSPSTLLPPMK